MGIDTVQWRAAIGTFISSRKDMTELEKYNFTSAGTLCSSENRSSDWEDDFELDNQSTSVAYHLGNVVINFLALCVPVVALLLFCCGDLELNACLTLLYSVIIVANVYLL